MIVLWTVPLGPPHSTFLVLFTYALPYAQILKIKMYYVIGNHSINTATMRITRELISSHKSTTFISTSDLQMEDRHQDMWPYCEHFQLHKTILDVELDPRKLSHPVNIAYHIQIAISRFKIRCSDEKHHEREM